MDINRLRYFTVIADTGSLRQAAELLYLSPTALSKAVRVLEGEVGTKLVQQAGRGIELTEQGRLLAIRAKPILAELATIPDELNSRRTQQRPLRYGSHEVFGTYFTRALLDVDPTLEFEHRYLVPGSIETALLDHAIDLGISYIPVPTEGTESTEVVRAPMGIFGLAKFKRTAFDKLRFAAPAGPVIGSPVRAQGLDGWPDDRIARTVPYRVTHTETALELCRSGHAVAYFPQFVIELHNERSSKTSQLVPIPPPKGLGEHLQGIHLVTRSGERPHGIETVEQALAALPGTTKVRRRR